jgi:chromate transporter
MTPDDSNCAVTTKQAPRLHQLAGVFARFGNFTFGGGSATIATLQHEIVDRRQWLEVGPFHLCYALSRLTPGTNLLAFCTAIGWLLRRLRGSLVCLLAASIPCSIMAVAVTALYASWSKNRLMSVALRGALAAAVGVMIITGVTLIRPHRRATSVIQLVLFVGGSFAANYFLSISPLLVLVIAAIAGWFWPQRAAA